MTHIQINVSWIARGSDDLSSERIRQQFPTAPLADDVAEWQRWLEKLGISDRRHLLALCNPTVTITDPDHTITFDAVEAFEF